MALQWISWKLMGLFFTLVYILAAYLQPDTIFGGLAELHIQIIVALATLLFSFFALQGSGLLRMPQTYAILALTVVVPLSMMFSGWFGGAPNALMVFVPNVITFFFVALNCKRKLHLQLVVGVLLFAALFTIGNAVLAIRAGSEQSSYLLSQHLETGEWIYRIKGRSFLGDPNDLSQFLVGLIPCLFIFWSQRSSIRNFFLVIVPMCVLLYGMYLTHSRGGMVALMAAVIVAGRRKIGAIPAVILGVAIFAALSAVGWSGGREVSEAGGADRMDAWSTGLTLLRTHPLFGVGYGMFGNYYNITAHNTLVVCAAEIGGVGLVSWMLLVFCTVRDAVVGSTISTKRDEPASNEAIRPAVLRAKSALPAEFAEVLPSGSMLALAGQATQSGSLFQRERWDGAEKDPISMTVSPPPYLNAVEDEDLPGAELRRLSGLMVISLAGFLTAGWFLSRAHTMTLFVELGLASAIYRMSRNRELAPPPLEFPRALKLSAITSVCLLLMLYLFLRMSNLFGR